MRREIELVDLIISTIYEKRVEYADFADAIKAGRAKGINVVTNALFTKAKGGDTPAMKYYLNNRDGDNWKDKVTQEIEGSLNLNLSTMSDAELDKIATDLERERAESK